MEVTTIEVDRAKTVFVIHGMDTHGKAVLRKSLKRHQVLAFLEIFHSTLSAWRLTAVPTIGRAQDLIKKLDSTDAQKPAPPQFLLRPNREIGHTPVRLLPRTKDRSRRAPGTQKRAGYG